MYVCVYNYSKYTHVCVCVIILKICYEKSRILPKN